jgi:uncharacterized ion transporter superfamily protein YfcC
MALALPVPSSSGRAVLTMPIFVPWSDLLGLARQVTALAYQYGSWTSRVCITDRRHAHGNPCALAGVRYDA